MNDGVIKIWETDDGYRYRAVAPNGQEETFSHSDRRVLTERVGDCVRSMLAVWTTNVSVMWMED